MLGRIATYLISRAERRIGVKLDYTRKIASNNIGLFLRYAKIFGFLDPNKHVPAVSYHAARICGAISSDCGTCVEAEVNLARKAGMSKEMISDILTRSYAKLPSDIEAIVKLASAVTTHHDDPISREKVIENYGEAGLIELAFAMNGAALLPGIKRALGFATTCDLDLIRELVADQ